MGRAGRKARSGKGRAQAGASRHAHWIGIALLALVGIRIQESIPRLAAIHPVLLMSVLGAGILSLTTGRHALRSAWDYPLTKLVLGYWGWIAITVPFGLWSTGAFLVWKGMFASVVMYLALILCPSNRGNLDKVLWSAVLATGLYLLLNFAGGMPTGRSWRMTSTGAYDANDMAALFAVVLPLSAGLMLRSRGFARLLALGMCALLVFGLLQTGSRGGILATAAGVSVFVLAHRGFRLFVLVIGVSAGGIIAWQAASPEFRQRMRTLTSLSEDYNVEAETGRVEIWKRGLTYFLERPVFGVGAGNFSEREGAWLLGEARSGKWSAAHNAYVQSAVELGAAGVSLFLGLLVVTAIRAKRFWRVKSRRRSVPAPPLDRPELFASVAAAMTSALFLSMAYSSIIFAVTALVAFADRVASVEVGDQRQSPANAMVPR